MTKVLRGLEGDPEASVKHFRERGSRQAVGRPTSGEGEDGWS